MTRLLSAGWFFLAAAALAQEPLPIVDGDRVIQQLLDPFCLIDVHINPESRVNVARGAAAARLTKDKDTYFLVKVHNEAGVTARVGVSGPHVISEKAAGEGHWLEAEIITAASPGHGLAGQKLEYMVLRLRPRESGKREATLQFDAGQGSQDLGFRAEVPVLFQVQER